MSFPKVLITYSMTMWNLKTDRIRRNLETALPAITFTSILWRRRWMHWSSLAGILQLFLMIHHGKSILVAALQRKSWLRKMIRSSLKIHL